MNNIEIYENAGTLVNKVMLLTSGEDPGKYPPAGYLKKTVMEILLISTEIDDMDNPEKGIKTYCLLKKLCLRAISLLDMMILDSYAGIVVISVLKADIKNIICKADTWLREPFGG